MTRFLTRGALPLATLAPGTGERHELGRLPQFFADMHGWRGLAEATAAAFHRLPSDVTIWAARGLRRPLERAWKGVKHFD